MKILGGKRMILESMRSYGWGYTGSNENGFEWFFTPDPGDRGYKLDENGKCYPFCCVKSGAVFKTETAAIKNGKAWMRKVGRVGTITAVAATPRHFEY